MSHPGSKNRRKIKQLSSSSGSSTDDSFSPEPPERSPSKISHPIIKNRMALNKSLSDAFKDMDEEINTEIDNDDENELRARRRSRMAVVNVENLQSPSAIEQMKPSGGMDNKHMAEHYGNCIKLAAENKITAKNAFQLHLIDYMSNMLDKITVENFQMASACLDASAKIYAGRVDAVHQDTYKVLTSLGRSYNNPNNETGTQDEADDAPPQSGNDMSYLNDNEEDENDPKQKKLKEAREKKRRNIILKNLNKIRVKSVAFQCEVDPLFQQQAAAYDEGGTSELRLNRVNVIDDSAELILDSNVKIFDRLSPTDQSETLYKTGKVHKFSHLFDILKVNPTLSIEENFSSIPSIKHAICQEFRTFDFNQKNADKSTEIGETSHSNGLDQHAFDIDDPIPDEFNQNDSEAFEPVGAPDLQDPDDDDNLSDGRTSVYLGENRAMAVVHHPEKDGVNTNENGTEFVTCLREMINEKLDRYGSLSDNLLGMWAGPSLWRNKLKKQSMFPKQFPMSKADKQRTSQTTNSAESNTCEKGKRRKKVTPTLTFCESSGERRDWSNDFFKSKNASTILADATVLKYTKKKNKLPLGKSEKNDLFFLMCKELIPFTKMVDKQDTNIDEDMFECYNFENPRDANEFCPTQEADDYDGDNMGFDGGDDLEHPFDGIFTVPDNINMQEEGEDGNNLELVSQPRHVAKIHIDYARIAKRIDVKSVKYAMWSVLAPQAIQKQEKSDQQESSQQSEDTPIVATGHMNADKKLSELIEVVPTRVSKQTASDLSMPVLIACLLYLSNEKGLYLESTLDFDDLIISQNLPESEIECLREYARRSAKTSAEVEEHRRRSLQRPKKKRQTLLDSWLDEDDNDVSQS